MFSTIGLPRIAALASVITSSIVMSAFHAGGSDALAEHVEKPPQQLVTAVHMQYRWRA
jgi:hypothetical protein